MIKTYKELIFIGFILLYFSNSSFPRQISSSSYCLLTSYIFANLQKKECKSKLLIHFTRIHVYAYI